MNVLKTAMNINQFNSEQYLKKGRVNLTITFFFFFKLMINRKRNINLFFTLTT